MIGRNSAARTTMKKHSRFAAGLAAAFVVDGVAVSDVYKAGFVWLNRWVERAEWTHCWSCEVNGDIAGTSHSSYPLTTSSRTRDKNHGDKMCLLNCASGRPRRLTGPQSPKYTPGA